MPQVPSKTPRGDQTIQPTGDLLSLLTLSKDDVNTALLRAYNQSADLVNVLVSVEDQVRDATEQALKSVKTDVEKKKRKISSGIKRLQDVLKR